MAIDRSILRMFITMKQLYRFSGKIVVFGVQDVMLSHDDAEQILIDADHPISRIPEGERRYSQSKLQELFGSVFQVKNPMSLYDLLKMMGFTDPDALDVFDTEKPTIVHDLNTPIPDNLQGKYDVAVDIGVMEHVFNVKQFVQNCTGLLKDEGVLFLYVPMLGWHNECFYNLQPPFFFDVFSANGFDDISVYLHYFPKYHNFRGRTTWVKFEYGDRPKFNKMNYYTHILMVAKKARTLPEFIMPVQSFYQEYHRNAQAARKGQTGVGSDERTNRAKLSHYMLDNMPRPIRALFPFLVPAYRLMPTVLRVPIVDMLMRFRNRATLSQRERFRF